MDLVGRAMEAGVTSEQLLHAIRRLRQRSIEHARLLARDAGLAVPELLCLRAVDELPAPECTVAHVAQHANLSLPSTSRILSRLVDEGFLRREHTENDRRKVFLALTALGRARLDEGLTGTHASLVARIHDLDDEERTSLLNALTRLIELMDDCDRGPGA